MLCTDLCSLSEIEIRRLSRVEECCFLKISVHLRGLCFCFKFSRYETVELSGCSANGVSTPLMGFLEEVLSDGFKGKGG